MARPVPGPSLGCWRSSIAARASSGSSSVPSTGQRSARCWRRSPDGRRTRTTWPPSSFAAAAIHSSSRSWRARRRTLAPPEEPLPTGLRDLLLARVAELGDAAQEVVRVASAAGRVVDDDLLAKVVELPERDLVQGLHEAIDQGILVHVRAPGVDGYGFRHPLLREVVAGRLLPIEARRLHGAFAAALTEDGAAPSSAAEVAFHWDAAGEAGRALEASVEAAAAAEAVYAFADARGHYERALRLWELAPYADDRLPIDRLGIIDRAAAMAALMGEPQRAIALAREALAAIDPAVDPERAALFHSSLRWYLWDAGDHEAALRTRSRPCG